MRIGIIGAMEVEVATLIGDLAHDEVTRRAGMEFHAGAIDGADVVVVRSGVGKVSAALCAQVLVDLFGVGAVVNTGVAGSLDARIDVGDVVVSTDAMYHDVDATVFGYAPGEVPQLGRASFPADESLRAAALRACAAAAPDVTAFEGRVVSGDQFIADAAAKRRIRETFGGMCCEMEGAAIAHACWANGVPFVIVRAISDKADGSQQVDYPTFERKAARDCAAITRRMVTAELA